MDRMLEATARAEERHFWFRGLRRNARVLLEEALGHAPVSRLVDCGAGTGRNLDWLEQYGLAIGIEQSWTGLRLGRGHQRRLIRATVTSLPLADASVDVATSFDVLYCLDETSEQLAIREMWRVLKPGGVALINAAALDILHGSHSALTLEQRRYTRTRLQSSFKQAGFLIERLTFTNMWTFPLTLVVRMADRFSGRVARASDAELHVPPAPINLVLDGILATEAALLRVMNLPIGTSLMCVARKPRGKA